MRSHGHGPGSRSQRHGVGQILFQAQRRARQEKKGHDKSLMAAHKWLKHEHRDSFQNAETHFLSLKEGCPRKLDSETHTGSRRRVIASTVLFLASCANLWAPVLYNDWYCTYVIA